MIGALSDVVESTLVTDVSDPSKISDTSWIMPGAASWIYWAHNHGSKDFKIVKDYIDLAVDMKWPYSLIDAEWCNYTFRQRKHSGFFRIFAHPSLKTTSPV